MEVDDGRRLGGGGRDAGKKRVGRSVATSTSGGGKNVSNALESCEAMFFHRVANELSEGPEGACVSGGDDAWLVVVELEKEYAVLGREDSWWSAAAAMTDICSFTLSWISRIESAAEGDPLCCEGEGGADGADGADGAAGVVNENAESNGRPTGTSELSEEVSGSSNI